MRKKSNILKLISFLSRISRDPIGLLGLVLVVIAIMTAIFAPWLTPADPNKLNIRDKLQGPSFKYFMGTDQLGRDVFSRVIMGSRIAMKVAMISISIALVCGLVLGLIAGYGPRWLDRLMILFFDTVRSFPSIMLALAIVTLVGPSLQTIIMVVVITTIPVYGRIIRAQTQSMKNNEYILAERAMGASMTRILSLHMLPNIIGPILIIACMDIPVVIMVESGLSFLGFGVRPPTASWGSILNDGYSFINSTPWLIISSGIPIILTTLGFTFFGEALRDLFDPKLRKDI